MKKRGQAPFLRALDFDGGAARGVARRAVEHAVVDLAVVAGEVNGLPRRLDRFLLAFPILAR